MNVDVYLDDIRWIRGLAGERLSSASYNFLPDEEKGLYFPRGEISTICAVCYPPTDRGQVFLNQTPGRPPPRICGRGVNNVIRKWVGAPIERPPFRIHDAVVGFIDRSLSRTHNVVVSSPRIRKIIKPNPPESER